MRKNGHFLILAAMILMMGTSLHNPGNFYERTNRSDCFTNDTEISSVRYKSNKHKYHSIFQMGLAGPGLMAWNYATGKGVNVAVMDGGFDVNDKELKGNIKGCYNAVTKREGKGQITKYSHGTSVAKILGAAGNNRYAGAGVAYNVNLYLIQVDANGSQSSYSKSVMEGIRYAANKKCRVISMSLSDTIYDAKMEAAINEAYSKSKNSILFAASAGNKGKEEYRYPSSYRNVLSVSALNYSSNTRKYTAAASTYNNRVDISAPGGTTSAATPYAAGVAALIFQANPSLTAKECADIITSTAMDAGSKGYDKHYGYGIIQPLTAVQKAKYGRSYIPRKISGTSSYKKSYGTKPFTLNAKIAGSGSLSYKSGNAKVASVNGSGKVTIRGTGRAVIKASVPKSGIYSSASKNITINVSLKRPSLSIKNIKKKKLSLSWKKEKRASGYEIYIAPNSKFKKYKKYMIKKSQIKKTVSRLKKNKKYWVRMRSYKTAGGRKIYSSYSKVKTIKIRK